MGLLLPISLVTLFGFAVAQAASNSPAQFIEITADISVSETNLMAQPVEVNQWSYSSRCLVSSNTWLIDQRLGNSRTHWWFTGSNVVKHVLITSEPISQDLQDASNWVSQKARTPGGRMPHLGTVLTNVFPITDGRPPHTMRPTLPWLAYCSASTLRQAERELPTPMEGGSYTSDGRFDKSATYPDPFGLPRHVEFYTRERELVSVYEAQRYTNWFGIHLPLEFSATGSDERKTWLISGKVTSIRKTNRFEVPSEVRDVLGPR